MRKCLLFVGMITDRSYTTFWCPKMCSGESLKK
jgi:hypothetical protein